VGISVRQIEVLNTVHRFHLALLQRVLGHEVPVPGRIERLSATPASDITPAGLQMLREWLDLLDLAITPLMVRDAMKTSVEWPIAEALICHYAWKASPTPANRDKADFIATYMFRHPQSAEWGTSSGRPDEILKSIPRFETALAKIFGTETDLQLPQEHRHLAREFEFFVQEAEDFRSFEEMMDSGLMQRVREVKESLGRSFYHPHVLAIIAGYNWLFGQSFDNHFHAAARSIKSFAEKVQLEGGSIMSRVDGEVTVKHLTDLEETKILEAEYQRSMESFHRVSRYKKAVDSRRGRAADTPLPVPAHIDSAHAFDPPQSSHHKASASHIAASVEESRILGTEETIGHFIRAAGSTSAASVVPLRHGNLGLRAAEIEAFKVDYLHEKSFRGDSARLLVRIVALLARMQSELTEFRAKQSSSYLWKPHADSLAYLIRASEQSSQLGEQLTVTARQRGLEDKANTIQASLQRLQDSVQVVTRALEIPGVVGT
jgi:hypothetical protein